MKKLIALFMCCVFAFSFVACSESQGAAEEKTPAIVDENLLTVDITLNASLFDGMSADEIISAAKANGVINCVVNEDGSVVYTMTKAKHEEMLAEMKAGIEESINGLLNGDDKVASFVSIDYNEDFSVVNVKVDPAKYSTWDTLNVLMFYISGAYYQAFAGVPFNEIDIVVNFINNNTQEIMESASYQKYMANAG